MNSIINKNLVGVLLSIFTIASSLGCKKFIDVETPATSINMDNVYEADATAAAVLTGLYARMSQTSTWPSAEGVSTISVAAGLSSDELSLFSGSTDQMAISYYQNANLPNLANNYWSNIYPYIYTTNAAIEGLEKSITLTASVKQQLLGEAKFLRGFFNYYLVNLFGEIPLVLTTNYNANASLAREPKEKVYQQIIKDLLEAKDLLSEKYFDGLASAFTVDRLRPTKAAAAAMLSRTYLYTNDWSNAEAQASFVINNKTVYDTTSLSNVFKKNSKEAIWQLQPVYTDRNTEDARLFVISNPPAGLGFFHPVYLNTFLLNAFEPGDNRRNSWVNSYTTGTSTYYFPFKYQVSATGLPVSEYLMVLRLGEQYLIRAEAKAQQNKIAEAQADLNVIRKRAGLLNTTAADKTSLLISILQERRIELFTEWGHRWLDLKRTGSIDNVMSVAAPVKGSGVTWASSKQYYPLPLIELQRNSNLVQNTGY